MTIVLEDRFDAALAAHRATVDSLAGLRTPIVAAARAIVERMAAGGGLFWVGNGGSAADSQHLAAELVGRFEGVDRPGRRSVSLTTDTSVLTSVANDLGFDRVFTRQVEALCRPGDVLLALSTSGRSPSVVAAVRAGIAGGVLTVALSGGDGGPLAEASDLAVTVPGHSPARIQEAHILIGHFICEAIHEGLSGD